MTLERPKPDLNAVRVAFVDSKTGKSKTFTLYDTTPEEAYEAVLNAVRKQQAAQPPSGPKPAESSAA